MNIPNMSDILKLFQMYSTVMQIFKVSLPLKKPLVATLSETCAITTRTNVPEKGITITN